LAMDRVTYPGRLGFMQRVLTPYRATFFDTMATACDDGVGVLAGLPRSNESIATTAQVKLTRFTSTRNIHLFNGPLYLCFQRGVLKWLVDWNPDILIVEANPRYLSTPAAVRWMKQRGRPVLGWGLGESSDAGLFASLRKTNRQAFLRQFNAMFTYSHRGAEQYAALGFPADRIFVAPNAASLRPASPLPIRSPTIDGQPTILFVGRLQARKRLDALLHACAVLSKRAGQENIQPHLVIVGDGPERTTLEELAKSIYPAAEFTGAKFGPELVPYFSAADLFVLPGTGGLAVQEAMAFGLPVIMGKGDGTNDDLVRPTNGWQLSCPENLQVVLHEALSDIPRLRAMGVESYRIVLEEINLERMVEIFIRAVNQILVDA
jgi:glycosyltransferase involved in cell wall biosynthesis